MRIRLAVGCKALRGFGRVGELKVLKELEVFEDCGVYLPFAAEYLSALLRIIITCLNQFRHLMNKPMIDLARS